jgi:phospholipid/cholesterol/gamma-HCH transport system ATP-binding protein
VAQGTPDEIRASGEDYVCQFVHGQMDGPVPFHYAGRSYPSDLRLESALG